MTDQHHQEIAVRWEGAFSRAHRRVGALLSRLRRREGSLALGRLVFTIAVAAGVVAVYSSLSSSGRVFAIAGGLFGVFAVGWFHRRLLRQVRFWSGLQRSYELSLARLQRRVEILVEHQPPWHGELLGKVPPGHLYATDLDITTGVFGLLDTCSTREGSDHLLSLLLEKGQVPASADERALRQQRTAFLARRTRLIRAVEALRFDEEFLYLSLRVSAQQKKAPGRDLASHFARKTLISYLVMAFVGIVAWAFMLLPALGMVFSGHGEEFFSRLIMYAFIPFMAAILYKPLVDTAKSLERHTKVLEVMLNHVESLRDEPAFSSFASLGSTAARTLRRLRMALAMLSVRNNPVVWLVLHAVLPYDSIVSLVVLRETRRVVTRLPQWVRDVAEFDTCCALARWLVEDPGARLCDLEVPETDSIEMQDVGHPLISPMSRVANSFLMADGNRLTLLTGSNMSGKSTFLRALGVNMVLAACGAPVCASRMLSRPRRILCAVRVDDSVAEGTSYFYAEVKRLKAVLDVLGEQGQDCLFLIDEIFRGTNNRERYVGAWHIIQALVRTGAPGLVSTHDLSLTSLADEDSRIHNAHFREHVESNHLIFDYTLRSGPSPTTNALLIMHLQGLPVPREVLESH